MGFKDTYSKALVSVRNFLPTSLGGSPSVQQPTPKKANTLLSPLQLSRIRVDIGELRSALSEAELPYYPHRVKLQRIYQDTILNGQVETAMQKRKDLTLLKNFQLKSSETVNEEATKYLQSDWFYLMLNYILDARAFGYSPISFGDMVDAAFPEATIVKRWYVSPDRKMLGRYIYSMSGERLDDPTNELTQWSLYVDTPSETGASICGYGYLLKVAYYEIFIRQNVGFNATALELFGQPTRVLKTSKTDEYERATLFSAGVQMGNSGVILMDPTDDITLVEASGGQGKNNGFESFETRMLKMVSKIILGHADAIDSQTGKLGGEDAAKEAIERIEKVDNMWVTNIVNSKLIPKLQALGCPIPLGLVFEFLNTKEKEERREKEDASNKVTAEIFQTIKNAGGDPDWKYFTERTGIPVEKSEEPAPALNPMQQQKLKNLYAK